MSDTPDHGDEATPLDRLGVIGMQTVSVGEELDHLELFTMRGLLSILWHGPADAEEVVVAVGGAAGGLLGPHDGLYHRLGVALAREGRGLLRMSYRRPNDLDDCVHDMLATMELAGRHGGRRFAALGHSFGGAVAVQAAAHLAPEVVPAVVTFATQSAGCERADLISDRDLLLFHGDADAILPPMASEMVRMIAGTGELVLLPGADHLLRPAGPVMLERLLEHLPRVLAPSGPTDS